MRRLIILGAAIPAGLLTGLAAWLTAKGPLQGGDRLIPIEVASAASSSRREPTNRVQLVSVDGLITKPLFPPQTGEGAYVEPEVRLDGISISRGRAAALISIAGASPQWVRMGEELNGVTLVRVLNGAVLVDLGSGEKELALGQRLAGTGQPAAGGPLLSSPGSTDPTAMAQSGFRSPPPPASASAVQQ